jgi:hypothetical protein
MATTLILAKLVVVVLDCLLAFPPGGSSAVSPSHARVTLLFWGAYHGRNVLIEQSRSLRGRGCL